MTMASRDAWLAARQGDVTASTVAALLNIHPYLTRFDLYMQKAGRLDRPQKETDAMYRGTVLEPVVARMVRDRHPEWKVEYQHQEAPVYYRAPALRIGATPDAFCRRTGEQFLTNLQLKTASEEAFEAFWLDPDTKEVIPPLHVALQALVESMLTQCPASMVAVMVLTRRGHLKLYEAEIPQSMRLWQRVLVEVQQFWDDIAAGREPDPDFSRDGDVIENVYRRSMLERRDMVEHSGLDDEIRRFHAAREAIAVQKKIIDDLSPRIRYALGNAEGLFTENFTVDAPTVGRAGYQVQPTTYRALKVKRRTAPQEEISNGRF